MTREEAINIVRNIYQTDKEKEALATLIPELAESEDERIRKALIEGVSQIRCKGDITREQMIAYLEKQKEQKPSGETNVEPDSKIPREEYLYHLLANHIITFTDYTYLLAKKPFDYECANIPQKDYTPVEQKPADLSEMMVHKEPYIAPVPTPMVADEQKPEWSEEDEKMLWNIISIVGESKSIQADEMLDWLKSLRPSWKPSEQEKGALRTAIHILTDERNFPKAAAQLQNILNAFEGEESRKDWKPSEEQMEALKWLIEYVAPSEKYIVLIKNLCDDLSKL